MKRFAFRSLVVGLIVALGLLAIARAQHTGADAPPDDGSYNPLRGGSPQPAANDPPANYPAITVDPANLPQGDNPLRPRSFRRDASVQPVSNQEPQDQPPTRIQFIAGGTATGPNAAGPNATGPSRPAAGQPSPVPNNDRYTATAQPTPVGNIDFGLRPVSDPRYTYLPGSTRAAAPDDMGRTPPIADGTGQPGNKQLEGPQSPQIVLEKVAPPEIQVGRPAVLRVVVRNRGTFAAREVEIHDRVPRGTRLLGTAPPVNQGAGGELVWSLGEIKPGGETSVEMQIMPTDEGEVGSVATVRFEADATARSMVTRPKLAIETHGTARVLLGEDATLTFTVSNPGSGVANGVVLSEQIPAGLTHPGGSELSYTIGKLKPGESRQLQLRLKAVKPGAVANVITVRADANLRAEHRFELEVIAPQLAVALAGPHRRYLEREAVYQVSVSNPGTAPAHQVDLAAYLPTGLKFLKTNHAGRYDEATRTVYWRLDELPVNQPGTVELVTLPVEQGPFTIKVRAAAQRGLVAEKEQPVLVEGLAAVSFQLSHTVEPIAVGGDTSYEITVLNQGSKASSNLQLAVSLPAELRPLAAEGPTRFNIESNRVVFQAIPRLDPKTVATFRVRARGIRPGDLRVRCQLMTDEMQQPVVKEERTQVYADE